MIKKFLESIPWNLIVKAFALIILLFIFVGFVNKHISYTLIEGSIFEPMRDYFALGIVTSEGFFKFVFSKLDELFHCKHCMTYQVGLWSTLFLIIITYYFWPKSFKALKWKRKIIYFLTIWFALGTFNAASGYKWWSILEYENEKLALQISQHHTTPSNNNTQEVKKVSNIETIIMYPDEFLAIFEKAEKKCDYNCPTIKRDCRARTLKNAWENEKVGIALVQIASKYPLLLSPARSTVAKKAFALFKEILSQ